MSRLPIRVRLTVVFAVAMAIVLSTIGAFLYVRLGDSLEEQLNDSLENRTELLVASIRKNGLPTTLEGGDEAFGQVIEADGTIVAASPGLERMPVLSASQRERAADGRLFLDNDVAWEAGEGPKPARVLVSQVENGQLLVVGGSREDRNEALEGLRAQLLVAGPMGLVLASLAGYLLAGAALRPVEAMRRKAGEISADTAGHRLPLPVARDEISRLGETLNAMLERLDAGLRRERRFVADAGHELRTPLALLQTELELALRRPRSREDLEDALRSANEEVHRLTRLAEDLLVLASTEEGRLPLRVSEFPVRELLDGVARRFAARAEAAGRRLEVAGAGDGTMRGDPLRLEQALGNLVDNALRHGEGVIRLEAANENGSVELSVRDEGAGFPQAFVPRAFERFSRAEEARTGGGAGLGLAIVGAVARAHGGTAQVGSGAEGGAVVTIVIPASQADRGPFEGVRPPEHEAASALDAPAPSSPAPPS
jgi:two-component system OmpR family sensor kinase